jgi:two-component SAPR family response regulator
MKIIILDDDVMRHLLFDKLFKGHDIQHVLSVAEFTNAINNTKYDIACLDHDLGTVETGVDAAKAIVTLPENQRPNEILIHSWNPVGAENMRALLSTLNIKVTVKPFKN